MVQLATPTIPAKPDEAIIEDCIEPRFAGSTSFVTNALTAEG